jgi:phosphoribosylaminoimidazolecarboxamide formyltransferase/IMP cyclohydrolase
MATSHSAIKGSTTSLVRVTRALLSVTDKTGLVALGKFLSLHGVELLSTGGTATQLRQAGLTVKDVAEYTGSPEMLDGRVKTLHPMIHGGLLAVRGNMKHEQDMNNNGIKPIDLVVLNLYPFEQTVSSGADFDTCIENIDIGGPSMLRSSAKNHQSVVIISDPVQYESLMDEMTRNNGSTTIELRRKCAAAAFSLSAKYDGAVARFFAAQQLLQQSSATATTTSSSSNSNSQQQLAIRTYKPEITLKYGCNPHQVPASICSVVENGSKLPFSVLNGTPGYINFLDAANSWQLVRELKRALGLPAAASFKHVSPAGAGVAIPLTPLEAQAYEFDEDRLASLTPTALAYVRARNADPMCSFGDFAAVSEIVDVKTAQFLKTEVSDGIVALGYEPEALNILKGKKNGTFIILQADPSYIPPDVEYREVYGMGFMQKRNDRELTTKDLEKVMTSTTLTEDAKRDLLLASIAVKYTQSNSVGYARGGQVVGIGAGQQSRVDCVKLAGKKVAVWYLRQHPKVLSLKFKSTIKRQERINARARYIEGDMAPIEKENWQQLFEQIPQDLTLNEKETFLTSLKGVSLSSDAFFPFRDSIDVAAKLGVSFVVQPGGSVQDKEVIEAAETYGMSMAFSNVRLFLH